MRFIFAFAFMLLLPSTPASGAVVNAPIMCGDRDTIVSRLATTYNEEMGAVGLGSNGNKIEIYSSEMGTFTIIFTRPNGWTCVMVAGNFFEYLERPLCGLEI